MDETSFFIKPDNFVNNSNFTQISAIKNEGFNQLYRAKRYGRWWLIKALKKEFKDDTTYNSFLQKEYDLMTRLNHPNIVQAFSFEDIPQIGNAIVMEWIDGVTLNEWLTQPHKNKERKKVAIAIIEALKYIHSLQIQHRDLKPSNIMVILGGNHIKLIDFGLGDSNNYAILKQSVGTKGYVAPDGPSDIYSFGKLLKVLDIGLFSRYVINKCCATKVKRYNTIDKVEQGLNLAWRIPKYITTAILIIIFSSLLYLLIDSSRSKVYEKAETIEQSITDDKNKVLNKEKIINNIIDDIKKECDSIADDSNIVEQIDTWQDIPVIFNVQKQMFDVLNNKCQNLPEEIKDCKEDILIKGSIYFMETYITPWTVKAEKNIIEANEQEY